jgi:hypothetical protein
MFSPLAIILHTKPDGPQGVKRLVWQSLPEAEAPRHTMVIDDYVIETLMGDLIGHDRQPSAFIVYLFLSQATHSSKAATVQIALQDIAERTGLSKRSVQTALGWLVKRKLIGIKRESITAIPVYTVMRPWRRGQS